MVRANQKITDPNTNPVNNPAMRNQSPPTQDVQFPNLRGIRQQALDDALKSAVQSDREGFANSVNYQDIIKRMTNNYD
jgi:hypothetical protein